MPLDNASKSPNVVFSLESLILLTKKLKINSRENTRIVLVKLFPILSQLLGISPKSLRKVIRLNAKVIIYVSCNPATQARDLVTLNEMEYELKKFSLVDQFPHTAHIESIMLFEKN